MQGSEFEVLSVEAGIYHGGELLGKSKLSHEVSATMYPRWNQWLQFDIPIKCLPKAARLCLQVTANNVRIYSAARVLHSWAFQSLCV